MSLAERIIAYSQRREADVWIGGRERPYLLRWWVIPRNSWFGIYLHNMRRSDDDRALHDHPYINISVVLRGGFWEIMPKSQRDPLGDQTKVWRSPGSIVWRLPTHAHRLELPHEGAESWSLFITFPRVRNWGFWCPNGKGWITHEQFVGPDVDPSAPTMGPGCD